MRVSRGCVKHGIKKFSLTRSLEQFLPKNTRVFVGIGLYGLLTHAAQFHPSWAAVSFMAMSFAMLIFFYPSLLEKQSPLERKLLVYFYPILMLGLLFVPSGYMMPLSGYKSLSLSIYLVNIALALCLFPFGVVLFMVCMGGGIMYWMSALEALPGFFEVLVNHKLPKISYYLMIFVLLYVMILCWKQEFQAYLSRVFYIDQERANKKMAKLKTLQYQHHADGLIYKEGYQDRILPDLRRSMVDFGHQVKLSELEQASFNQLLDRLSGYERFLAEDRHLHARHIPLDPEEVSLEWILDQMVEKQHTLCKQVSIMVHMLTEMKTICCDPVKLEQMVLDAIWLMQSLHPATTLYHLSVAGTTIAYKLNDEGNWTKSLDAIVFLLGLDAADLPVEQVYHDSLDDDEQISVKTEADLHKRSVIRLVDAHYGCYRIQAKRLTLVLPRDIHAIRDPMLNRVLDPAELGDYHTASSLHQEQKLSDLLVNKGIVSRSTIEKTLTLIKEAHKGQSRYSGEPYYIHPMAVAEILIQETDDADTILAALLHDVVEDTEISSAYLQSQYGSTIAGLVDGVTHLASTSRKKKLNLQEKHEKLSFLRDLRSLQIKLADRVHNLMTLGCRPRDKQLDVVKQTLDFYIPLARKVELNRLAKLLEEQCQVIVEASSRK